MAFVAVPFTSDAITLADQAVGRLTGRWGPGWEPSDADMEIIQISVLAPIAQSAIEVAAVVPDAIFRAYGTKLVGLSYQVGAPALGTARFVAIDNAGYTTDPNTVQFGLLGNGAETDTPVTITPGTTSVDVEFHMLESGTVGNELTGFGELISAVSWIDTITVSEATAGGTDPEDDVAYQDRLSERLRLRADTLVTGRDFEVVATQLAGIARATAIVGTPRAVTVGVLNDDGGDVATPIKNDLLDIYDQYRQVNTTYSVINVTRTTINVTFSLVIAPGYIPADVKVAAEAAVAHWLDPLEWGKPFDERYARWINETVVRHNELVRVVSVAGVRYVSAATLNGTTGDITLTGTIPVPALGTNVGTVSL